MFGTLARRLTAWYVFVAVGMVVLLAGSVAVAGLMFYARTVNEQIEAAMQQIPDLETRSKALHESFDAGAKRATLRLTRPGLIIRANPPGARRGESSKAPLRDPKPYQRYRFGYGAATFLGMNFKNTPFLGGTLHVQVDGERVQWIVSYALLTILLIGAVAGLFAWMVGRYITTRAFQPLFDVTKALQRFAARDFSAQPIAVADRGEFHELASAYNAAAAQVETAFAEANAAELQMRQFVADAGHELRTPLTIVLGYFDMLRKRAAADDERSRRIFDTIAIEGSRMRTLIDNLVLLARLDSEEVRPIEPFDLTALLEHDIVETRRVIAPAVRFDLDIIVDATIIGDRAEIYEAIANVVDNAMKYAPGSPIGIRVRPVPSGVEIAVSDRGPGIEFADREAIFDRFYRGAKRGEVEGSGLGLAIAKRAVERAGGSLTLAATSPEGTIFAIRLRTDIARMRTPVPVGA